MSGRKRITLIEGIPTDIDLKKVLKYFKREFNCNGTILRNEETGAKIIQLTGDKREVTKDFFIEEQIVGKKNVMVHG
jgi:translation initiation factor 1